MRRTPILRPLLVALAAVVLLAAGKLWGEWEAQRCFAEEVADFEKSKAAWVDAWTRGSALGGVHEGREKQTWPSQSEINSTESGPQVVRSAAQRSGADRGTSGSTLPITAAASASR